MTSNKLCLTERTLAEVDGIKLYYLTADHEEIVEIEARNTHKPELVTAA